MKTTARTTFIFAVAGLLLASCGNGNGDAELRLLLVDIADREGMLRGPCHDQCVSEALAAFDECVDRGGDRESCTLLRTMSKLRLYVEGLQPAAAPHGTLRAPSKKKATQCDR